MRDGIFPEREAEIRRQVAELEREIAELEAEQRRCQARARELLEREARGEGVFASQIFQCKQDQLRLATEIRHRQVRINHLLLGAG